MEITKLIFSPLISYDDDDDDVYINKYSNNIKMHGISYNPNKMNTL